MAAAGRLKGGINADASERTMSPLSLGAPLAAFHPSRDQSFTDLHSASC